MREIRIRATEKEIADLTKALQGRQTKEADKAALCDPDEQKEIAQWLSSRIWSVETRVEVLKKVCIASALLSTSALAIVLILL